MAALTVGLMGCAAEVYYPPHSGPYMSNIFYCSQYPNYGIDCPGGFYYDGRFFPDQYAFFTYYQIDRRHWKDFHGKRYWDRHDRDRHDDRDKHEWDRHADRDKHDWDKHENRGQHDRDKRGWDRHDQHHSDADDGGQWPQFGEGREVHDKPVGLAGSTIQAPSVSDRDLDAQGEGHWSMHNPQQGFPSNASFGPGNSIHTMPHEFMWHR